MVEDDWEDVRQGIEAYRRYKECKQDLEARWKRLSQEIELERLERLQKLSTDVLILAAQSPEQARLLHSLARLDKLKGMSPESILTILLENRPELAEVVREVLVRMHETSSLKPYEEMVGVLKGQMDLTREDYRLGLEKFVQMFERFAETSVGIARAATGTPPSPQANLCQHCRVPLPAGANFCPGCGRPVK